MGIKSTSFLPLSQFMISKTFDLYFKYVEILRNYFNIIGFIYSSGMEYDAYDFEQSW